jgi:hypothetical protein
MDRNTTYQHWRVVATLCGYTIPEKMERPAYVGDKKCPENLNELTIGQLIELGQVDGADTDYRIAEIVLGYDKPTTDKCRAVEVVPFLSWVGSEVKKINRLFETISHKPTAKERQAGVDKLQFGLFGMLDWFAKRMGITNHDDVLGVPWLRIYKCMDMDNQTQQYQQRLNDISMREATRKRTRK